MKARSTILPIVAIIAIVTTSAPLAFGASPTPKTLPDWSGAWAADFTLLVPRAIAIGRAVVEAAPGKAPNPALPPLTANALTQLQNYYLQKYGAANVPLIENEARCIPIGMPAVMSPLPFEMLMSPGRVTILTESGEARRIYTDGRPHPANLVDKFEGHSIGHWEGDALVVDTIAISDKSEMFLGNPESLKSNKTHVIERMRRVGPTRFQIDFEVSNPDWFTTATRYTNYYDKLDGDIVEAYCQENNRESTTDGEPDLTPPPL